MTNALQSAFVLEDIEPQRQWLCSLVSRAVPSITQVDSAASLESAAKVLSANKPYDLALLDWSLPDGTSESLIFELAKNGHTQVIVSTIHDDDAHVFAALRAGAKGYLLKSQPEASVLLQLQRIQLGEPALSPSVAMRILQHFSSAPQTMDTALEDINLSEQQTNVLRLIAKGYKKPEVAQLLSLSVNTVATHIKEVYRKLGINSRSEAALEAARLGLVSP